MLLEMTSAPENDSTLGVAVRSAVAKVRSVENSIRVVVVTPSGLIATFTNALELVIASTDLNSILGAA